MMTESTIVPEVALIIVLLFSAMVGLRYGGVICRRLLPLYLGRVANELPRCLLVASLLLSIVHPTVSVEYCQFESFNASCSANQVIVIEEAHYGRVRIGRCVTRDYGYLGCTADVTDILDRSCSGQRWCYFSVPTLRDLVQPCPKDLTAYLEATYRCETVVKTNRLRCNDSIVFPTNSSTVSLYVTMSPLDVTATVGSRHPLVPFSASCPVYIRSHSGQRIAVASYMFGVGNSIGGHPNTVDVDVEATRPGQYHHYSQQSHMGGSDGSASQRVGAWHLQQRRRHTCVPDGGGGSGFGNRAAGGLVYVVDHGRLKVVGELCNMPRYTQTARLGLEHGAHANLGDTSGSTLGAGMIYTSTDNVVGIFVDVHSGLTSDIALQESVAPKDADNDETWNTSPGLTSTDRLTMAFIIRVEVLGCADLPVPENSHVERHGDVLTVYCNTSHETWYLTCKGHNWIGGLANCSRGTVYVNGASTTQARKSISFGLILAVIVGIIIGVVFGMTMLISVLMIRRQRRRLDRCRSPTVMVSSTTNCKSHARFPVHERNIFGLSHPEADLLDTSLNVDGFVTYASRRSCPPEPESSVEAKYLRPTNYEPFYNVMHYSPRRQQLTAGCSSIHPTAITPPSGNHAYQFQTDLSYVHATLPATTSASAHAPLATDAALASEVHPTNNWVSLCGKNDQLSVAVTKVGDDEVLNGCSSWWSQDVDHGCLERGSTPGVRFPVASSGLPQSLPQLTGIRTNVDDNDKGRGDQPSVRGAQTRHQPAAEHRPPHYLAKATMAREQFDGASVVSSSPTTTTMSLTSATIRANLDVATVSTGNGGHCTRPDVVTTPGGGALN